MAFHEHATPNFRNLFVRPLWMTLKTMLRTFPIIGRSDFLRQHNGGAPYHGEQTMMFSPEEMKAHEAADAAVVGQTYAADRETSELFPHFERPLTIMYPYERLEEMEPWLFVPGNYNGRIGVIWETCTACKACVRICPNSCLHMSSETRVNVLEMADEGDEWHGYGSELEEGGLAARRREEVDAAAFNLATAHTAPPEEYDFGEIIDLSGDSATVRWNHTGATETVDASGLVAAEVELVSGRIDMGRCMFCGLCMEACPFTSFFMTNEYDGMSGHSREDLWFDAARTRVLPVQHAEAVDAELAKRAAKELKKRERAAAKAAKTEA